MNNWDKKMAFAIDSAKLLPKLNVIDVEFINSDRLEVYIALTKEERAIGLSTIPYLDLDGMLFLYEKPSFNPFTMNDMGFNLDIGWYDHEGKLIKSGSFEAGYSAPLFSPKPYVYVIETLAGHLPSGDLRVRNV